MGPLSFRPDPDAIRRCIAGRVFGRMARPTMAPSHPAPRRSHGGLDATGPVHAVKRPTNGYPTVRREPAAYCAEIDVHTLGLAEGSRGHMETAVSGCPGWSVRDVLLHLIEVQWFWATIVAERLQSPPDQSRRPAPPSPDGIVPTLLQGCDRLVAALKAADWTEPVWTWAPGQQDVAFIGRHQAQEAAIHHWDVATAAGRQVRFDPAMAADAVDEFLTFSVSSEIDPADPPRSPLDGTLAISCTDFDRSWTVTDGVSPGTVRLSPGAEEACPSLRASAADLLLWMYRRVEVDLGDVPPPLAERFRALCFTT